jgi:hypothetical protein
VKWYDANEENVTDEKVKKVAYSTENTMAAADQKLGGATRLVLKANYVPNGYTMGQDWYQSSLNGVYTNYETLIKLQEAYGIAKALDEDKRDAAQKALVISCEAFKTKLDGIYPAIASIADFAALKQTSTTLALPMVVKSLREPEFVGSRRALTITTMRFVTITVLWDTWSMESMV